MQTRGGTLHRMYSATHRAGTLTHTNFCDFLVAHTNTRAHTHSQAHSQNEWPHSETEGEEEAFL